MEAAAVVRVAVSAAPYSIDKPYDYLVPEELAEGAVPGVRVTVPFGRGNRLSEGMILALGQDRKKPGLKPISSVLDREPVLDSAGLALALWMRQRYFCTMFEAVKTILPAGLWYHFRETWRLAGDLDPAAAAEAAKSVRHGPEVFAALAAMGGSAGAEDLREACEDPAAALRALQKIGLVWCETSAKQKVMDKTRRMVELAVSAETALAVAEAKKKSSPARYEAVRLLAAAGRTSCADVAYFTGASAQVLRNMEKAGLVRFSEAEELRVPEPAAGEEPPPPIVLNEEQQAAYEAVLSMTEADRAAAILLHGVTGSGKTQVYLRLVQEILARGRTAIVLVPEIVLTPQIMRKFSAYLGADVAMLHSGLRMSERYDQWKRIRRGEVRVVLGTRSAVFAPLKNLGLVILDEEQEGSYQSENAPPYHAREVAKYLCARDKAVLVLGSATPSIETAWAAETGAYQKAVLRRRYNEQALPQVLIADLREEVKAGNAGSVGAVLRQELARNLERGEQSILFLNRRGNSRMLLCGECGYVPECPHCSAALTYHSANRRLMCHYCGFSHPVFEYCPDCAGVMKQIGTGTQKVEEELRALFPGTEILRMDSDTASGGHEPLLRRFEKERIPILLGTQMVTKGLDFENVTLVGVLAADLSLYIDSYRAPERTFSLLTQVVGRAGRGGKSGRAVIQTYTPENDVIRCAARQDYESFYESEIKLRRLRHCPPFSDLFSITVSGTEEGAVLRGATAVRNILRRMYAGAADTEVLGPAPAPVLKVKNRYRYRVLLAGRNDGAARANLSALMKGFASSPANRKLHIAVDCNASD